MNEECTTPDPNTRTPTHVTELIQLGFELVLGPMQRSGIGPVERAGDKLWHLMDASLSATERVTRHVPVIFISDAKRAQREKTAFELGVEAGAHGLVKPRATPTPPPRRLHSV